MDASHKALGCILTLGEKTNRCSNLIYFVFYESVKSWNAEKPVQFKANFFFQVNKGIKKIEINT